MLTVLAIGLGVWLIANIALVVALLCINPRDDNKED